MNSLTKNINTAQEKDRKAKTTRKKPKRLRQTATMRDYFSSLSQSDIDALEDDAREKDPESQYALAQIYREGFGTKIDYKKSHSYFMEAANNGFVEALAFLAENNYFGRGTQQNHSLADELLHKYINFKFPEKTEETKNNLFNKLKDQMLASASPQK